ncbi:hypothetical protein C8242_06680 [Paracidovorax avenae]|nr:hypothetical protein C8242_06680 [Paracidovorax avenae]
MLVHDAREGASNLDCASMKYLGEFCGINTCSKARDCSTNAQDLKLCVSGEVTYASSNLLP